MFRFGGVKVFLRHLGPTFLFDGANWGRFFWPFCKFRKTLGYSGYGFVFDPRMWHLAQMRERITCNAFTNSPSRNLHSSGIEPWSIPLQSGHLTS